MKRRTLLGLLGFGGLGLAAYHYWPDQGLINPCHPLPLPAALAQDRLILAAWEDVDTDQIWDCHVHLIGIGDSDSGIWVNPAMLSLAHPIQYAQRKFFLNAACADENAGVDKTYIERLVLLHEGLSPGVRLMLLAFDYHYNEAGERVPELSSFYTPDDYAARIAKLYPQRFEWIASIHPYREDCVTALEWAAQNGARAVKWLPPAMGMNPASPLCDRFYEAMARLNLPLLTHAGDEHAVHGAGAQLLGNPLLLRRALDHGVRVIVAHCASQGSNPDIDNGPAAPPLTNFALFARLMEEPRYQNLVYGDISAVTQINRADVLGALLQRTDWHARLVNGSDYPLPGVMPLFSMRKLVGLGHITQSEAATLSAIRPYNPLLFDFVLKRSLRLDAVRLANTIFESRRLFEG